MGRIIYTPLEISDAPLPVTNDADQDIWRLNAGANNKVILHGWELTSESLVAEDIELRLMRRTADGTGGTALVEVKNDEEAGSITTAITALITAPGTAGDVIKTYNWEQLGPLGIIYTPEMRPVIQESGRLVLHLFSALAGTTNMSGWICHEEI